jgi:isopentenyl diphosphate isomerase/L-lactate dehydrogenase-like FMN-dependent dehydrogenase
MNDTAKMADRFRASHDIIVAARQNLKQAEWDYVCGGAETETSLRRNRQALDSLAFRPRVLRDVSAVDTGIEFLGHKMAIPVMLAPIGGLQRIDADAALAIDNAAEQFGVVNFVSTATEPELEVTAANSPHPKAFQIYVRGDQDWLKDLVSRVKGAGYAMVALTVDLAYYGNRERLNPQQMALRDLAHRTWQKTVTWDTVKMLQDALGDIPFMIKGIQTAEDAALAVEHGVQVIYVSNHGGRQLDYVRGNIETLPEIADAVGGKAKIIIDGGFTRGTDILKALCLGADAVGIGRLQAWGLAAAGAAGVVRVLEIIQREIEISMGLLGVTHVDQLSPAYLTEGTTVRFPHEMSAFPHLPMDRVE